MKVKLAGSGALIFCLFAACNPLFAHHGGSDYDTANLKTLKGTVTDYHWSNPHCQIFVDVKDGSGKVVSWSIETLAPAVLKRAGWSREMLHPGDQITVTFAPSKRGTPVGMIRKVVLPDGKELTGGHLGELPE